MLRMHSPGGSTFLYEMTSWCLWNYHVVSEIWTLGNRWSTMLSDFILIQFWNGRAYHMEIWDHFVIQKPKVIRSCSLQYKWYVLSLQVPWCPTVCIMPRYHQVVYFTLLLSSRMLCMSLVERSTTTSDEQTSTSFRYSHGSYIFGNTPKKGWNRSGVSFWAENLQYLRNRCKIGLRLLLRTNIKSYTHFRLVAKSRPWKTLNGVSRDCTKFF